MEQSCLLAEVGDASLVVVRKHVVAKNSVRDLGRVHEVHLEQARLHRALFRTVVLERVQEERRRGLDHVLAHEDVDNALHVDKRARFVVHELHGELGALLRVRAHDVLQELGEVRLVADLLRVQQDLVGLPGFREARDDLVGDVGAKVDTEREGHVVQANDVTQLFAAVKLARR